MIKFTSLKIFLGIILLAAGAGVAYVGYQRLHSPLDAVPSLGSQRNNHNRITVPTAALPTSSAPGSGSVSLDPGVVSADLLPEASVLSSGNQSPVFYQGFMPDTLVIPSIALDAPIIPTTYQEILYSGRKYLQWLVPYGAMAGWQDTSALIGAPGNTVLNGHNNSFGEVFKNLDNLKQGDLIQVYSGDRVFQYYVALKIILPERFEEVSTRLQNARWIMPSNDVRLTLVTCWPADDSTNRLIIVAFPATNNKQ